MSNELTIIGGGLAGCEAAWQAAERGINVKLFEMRPTQGTGAHRTGDLAELVCSNSLGSKLVDRASGMLLNELKLLNSLLAQCADDTSLPAGNALAVDRVAFAKLVTDKIQNHPHIQLVREEVCDLPDRPTIVASGPLTSPHLAAKLVEITGIEALAFFDAIAPIVTLDSIDFEIAFRASRYNRDESGEGDYINCPFTAEQYYVFVDELLHARRIELKAFESEIELGVKGGVGRFFEGCLPVEVLAARGERALAFGPMRPIGLYDPRTGKGPFAVIQLRQDNLAGNLYNIVGFQTNLAYTEQERIFRLIPGLEKAEFVRLGQMHRNTYLDSPRFLAPTLQMKDRKDLFFAGQIAGIEGYLGNIGSGLLAGINAAHLLEGKELWELPIETMLGSLIHYITHAEEKNFQPMKANFGLLPQIEKGKRGKFERNTLYSNRGKEILLSFLARQ